MNILDSVQIRNKVVNLKQKKVSISLLKNSIQEEDISEPVNCEGYGRIRRFKTTNYDDWNINPLPNYPAAYKLGLNKYNIMRTQLFQLSGCNWNCWYCFVDDELRKADTTKSKFFTSDELVSNYLKEKKRPKVIVLSGGQPDLAPEWIIWMMEALSSKGLHNKSYLWSDDNLSTDFYFRFLSADQRDKVSSYSNYGKVGCFKGFDEKSFVFNTNEPKEKFEYQFELFDKLRREGIDLYGYVTFTSPPHPDVRKRIESFVNKLLNIHDKLPLRIVPLKIINYSPSSYRMSENHFFSLEYQLTILKSWNTILDELYSKKERKKKIHKIKIN